MSCERTCKPKMVVIWATFKLCNFKSLGCKVDGVKTKPNNCLSRPRYIKEMESIHFWLDPKDLEEALAPPQTHWDSWKETKVRKCGLEIRYQGQSTLDKCMEEYGCRSTKTKRYMGELVRLCAFESLPLHMCTCTGFVMFMR